MTSEVLQQLVELGRSGRDQVPPALANENKAWSLLLGVGREFWQGLGTDLPQSDLEAVIRGLVHYSRTGRPTGGSVSPVIWLFARYAARFPESEPSLTRWVVANRVNPYEPFGSVIENQATSIGEYVLRRLSRGARARSNEAIEHERKAEAASRRADKATTRLVGAIKRGDVTAVAALLATGADPSKALPDGSLVELAESHGRSAVAELLRSRGLR